MGRFDDLTKDLGGSSTSATMPNEPPPVVAGSGRFDDLTKDIQLSARKDPASWANALKLMVKHPMTMVGAAQDLSPEGQIKSKVLDPLGEKIAEAGGYTGHPSIAIPAAAVGTMVSEAPAFLGAATGLEGVEGDGDIGKAIRNTPKDLGPQYEFQNKAAGISGDLPQRAGKLPGFEKSSADLGDIETAKNLALNPPVSYPKDNAAFINFAKARMQAFGKDLTPEELTAYKNGLGGLLDQGKNRLESSAGRGAYALASKLKDQAATLQASTVTEALQQPGVKIPDGFEKTREGLNNIYDLSSKIHPKLGEAVGEAIKKLWPHMRWGFMKIG